MKTLISCSSYVLGQLFGPTEASSRITKAVQDERLPLPCFAVAAIRELAVISEATLRVDGGASHIGKSRSRHFYEALQSDCDVWVTIDDDVTATPTTLAWLLNAVEGTTPRVCIAPCVLRNGNAVNVEWHPVFLERIVLPNGMVRRASAGGFGLVAMNRTAMQLAARSAPSWKDPHDGHMKPAVFLEKLDADGTWTGEDVAFFRRLPREVEVEALVTGKTMHAGHELALEALRR